MRNKSKKNKILIFAVIILLAGINIMQELTINTLSVKNPTEYPSLIRNIDSETSLPSYNDTKSTLANGASMARIKKYVTCYSSDINTEENQEFVAEHFDMMATERTLYTAAGNIKTLNPNIKILAYYDSMVEPEWYEDWDTINQSKYESWFVHDKYGSNYYHRVTDVAGTHYLMKPNLGLTPNQQYTSWSDYYAKRAKTLIQTYPQFDGLFADEVTYNLSAIGAVWNVPYSDFQSGILPFEIYWGPNFVSHMQNVQQVLSGKPIVCNCWKWSTFCENATHMMMWEGFIHRRAHLPSEPGYSPEYAIFAINTLREQSQQGNTIIVNSGTKKANQYPQTAYKIIKYTLACFMFAVEDMTKSYYSWNFFGQDDDFSNGYYTTMDTEFGNPVGEYYHVKDDVYAREFQNKTVVANLNPTDTETVTVNGQQYQIGPTTGLFLNKTNPTNWWNANWGYRKKITIDHTKIGSSLVNFPVLISLTSDSNLASHTQSDGDDIAFTDSSGNKLNHEIELFTSSTGRLIAWVNVPSLSSSTDTVLYMYYGNSGCGSQQNKPGTWNSDYLMVQHMEETGTVYDSTSNGFNGVNYGASASSNGKINGCEYFNSLSEYYNFGTPSLLNPGTSSWTISLWTKISYVDSHKMMQKWANSNAGFVLYLYTGWGGYNYFKVGDGSKTAYRYWSSSWSDGNWHYITAVINRNTNVLDLYLDGNLNNGKGSYSIASLGGITCSSSLLLYGGTNGWQDEFCISKTARSTGWVKTSYNNQNNPSSFFSLGSQETNN